MHEQANNVINTPTTKMQAMVLMMMMITVEKFTKHPKATRGHLTKFMNQHLNDTLRAHGVR